MQKRTLSNLTKKVVFGHQQTPYSEELGSESPNDHFEIHLPLDLYNDGNEKRNYLEVNAASPKL